jgi:hypothetical protein
MGVYLAKYLSRPGGGGAKYGLMSFRGNSFSRGTRNREKFKEKETKRKIKGKI